jgi:hypothetical protein
MVFFVIELRSRAAHIAGIRDAPDGAWLLQLTRNLLDPSDGFLRHATHVIHDRDPLFTEAWARLLESSGVKGVAIPAQGLGGRLVRPSVVAANDNSSSAYISCRSRLGGLLNFYHRLAA